MQRIIEWRSQITYLREFFTLSDGGRIAIDWVDHLADQNNQPILVVIPGLTGNNNAEYVLNSIKEAKKYNYQIVLINYRAGSGTPLTTPMIGCCANTADFREPLTYIYDKYCVDAKGNKKRDIFMVSVSLGANLVLNLLGEDSDKSFITAATSIQPPINAFICSDYVKKSLFGAYGMFYLIDQRKRFARFIPFL